MRGLAVAGAAAVLVLSAPALADSADFEPQARELQPYLQCVPYARERSGVQLYGDAHTWWDRAEGRYRRGGAPRVGAVMAFRPHAGMRLGHVAAVSQVIDSRTVLLDHANWSLIDGRRGQIERGVMAIDVSPGNDWSEVRVWYAPLNDLGTTAWPLFGFIYNEREDYPERSLGRGAVLARANDASRGRQAVSDQPSRKFLQAFSGLESEPSKTVRRAAAGQRGADPVSAAIARYER